VNRSILISSVLHLIMIMITAMSLPFLAKKPIDLPPIVSVELIQITDKTNIPFAPKAKKTIEKIKTIESKLITILQDIQNSLFQDALEFQNKNTYKVKTYEEFKSINFKF